MKVFLTGGSGLLGSAISEIFRKNDVEVFDECVDIVDLESLREVVLSFNPDFIIHTAAITDVNKCEKEKDLCHAVNVLGTKNISDLAKQINAPIIFISSVSIFNGQKGDYKEEDKPEATNYYNQSKIDGEKYIFEYDKGTTIRLNLLGIHQNDVGVKNFFEWAVDSIKENKEINAFSDSVINPLSNWTIASILLEMIKLNDLPKIVHIGSSDLMSKADIVKYIKDNIDHDFKGVIKEVSVDSVDGPPRPKNMWLNVELAESIFGFKMPKIKDELDLILSRI